jgi:DNA-binding transcriptional MocR family regulator
VVSAYNELMAEGYIDARVGRGTVVSRRSADTEIGLRRPLNWPEFFYRAPGSMFDLTIRDISAASSRSGAIPLAAGLPSPDFFPVAHFRDIFNRLLAEQGADIFQLLPTEGYFPLRELLATWMIREGQAARPEEVLIVSGSIQGLYLVSRTLISPGDLIVIEQPTFFGAIHAFHSAGARLVSVPMDEEGMRIDILENLLLRHRPKFIYTLPTFQNPSGTVLSLERRRRLLDLSLRYQVAVIEDDPYGPLYYRDVPPPSLRAMDDGSHVIYLGTFSKILFPGLRVGWVSAPREVVEQLTWGKQILDLHTNTPAQYAVFEFCRQGLLDNHLETVRRVYRTKRDVMQASLKEHVSSLMETRQPEGGFYFWGRLANELESRDLIQELLREDVILVAGEVFYPNREGRDRIRMNFTHPSEDQIREGVRRIGKALQRLQRRGSRKTPKTHMTGKPIV